MGNDRMRRRAAAARLAIAALCAVLAVFGCARKEDQLVDDYDWSAVFDGPVSRVHQLPDGDYVVYGTSSYDGSILRRTDGTFAVKWSLDESRIDGDLRSVVSAGDGGLLLTLGGYTSTTIVRTDANGAFLWQRELPIAGGYGKGGATCRTADGGHLFAGSDGDRITLVKLGPDGSEQWRVLRDSGLPAWIAQTSDGGCLVGSNGPSWVVDGEFYELPDRVWKFDSLGGVVWSRSTDNIPISDVSIAGATPEGECLIVDYDDRLVKFDSSGNVKWWKDIEDGTRFASVQPTSDGGCILAGSAKDSTDNILLVKTDSNGTTEWSRAFGGDVLDERGIWAEQTADGGYIVAGAAADEHLRHSSAKLKKTDASGN